MNTQMRQITSFMLTGFLCLAAAVAAVAQEGHREVESREGGRGTEGPRMEPGFFRQLFPAEVVMRHADAIGLREDQKAAITSALPKLGKGASRERQTVEARRLEQLLKRDPVDEGESLAQLNQLLEVEDNFKRQQLQALIRIKNILTSEQRRKLDELRNEHSAGRPDAEPRLGPREEGSPKGREPRPGPREGRDREGVPDRGGIRR